MPRMSFRRRLDGDADDVYPYVGDGPRVVTIYPDYITNQLMVNVDVGMGSHTFPFTKELADALREAADQAYPREENVDGQGD